MTMPSIRTVLIYFLASLLFNFYTNKLLCVHSLAHVIQSSNDIAYTEGENDFLGVVDIAPVPRYIIDTNDPIARDQYISAAVHHDKTVPWESHIWDRIVSLTKGSVKDEGLVFVDVGANIGYFSLAAASLGYKVVAFEPTSINAKKLAKSIEMNVFDHPVTLYQNAVSGQIVSAADAAVVALSDVLDGMDAFIMKVDAEGDETKVLSSAKQWIQKQKVQHIIMKVSDATKASSNPSVSEIIAFMKENGYEMKDVDEEEVDTFPRSILFSLKQG